MRQDSALGWGKEWGPRNVGNAAGNGKFQFQVFSV